MSKPIPPVQKFMTMVPHTIAPSQMMVSAHTIMRAERIRHLPVLEGGKLVGIVSDRDLRLIESLRDVDPAKVKVEDAMMQDVYSVDPQTPVDEVVMEMAERKLGSAVLTSNGKVVGIFTTVDACRAFAELLHTRLAK